MPRAYRPYRDIGYTAATSGQNRDAESAAGLPLNGSIVRRTKMASRRVPIVTKPGEEAGEAEVSYHAENRRCLLQLRLGTSQFSGEGPDYFEALCEVRRQLEAQGLLLRSYGGSRNLVLSGMCRDVGAGLSGYRVSAGKRPVRADLVRIFDTGPDVEPATVDEQKAFGRAWLQSIAETSDRR